MPVLSFDRIKQAVEFLWYGKQPTSGQPGQTSGYQRPVTPEMESYDVQALKSNRYNVILDCQKMANTDGRIARALYKLAADAAVGGFAINPEEAQTEAIEKRYMGIIDETTDTCQLIENTKGWVHTMLQDGDLYQQIEVNEQARKITRLKELAAIITYSHLNSEGNFPKNKPAYYQVHPLTRQTVKEFERWQISHVGWLKKAGHPYGKPMFAPARLAFSRLDSSDKNLVIRRATRAGYTLHHQIGTEGEPGLGDEIEEYKRLNRDTLKKPMNVIKDLFSNGRVTINELSGDKTLGEMGDIEYFEAQVLGVTGIPFALLGFGKERDVNRDVLEEQEEDYYRVIADINDAMEITFRKVFSFAMLLAGLNPAAFKYSFVWGAKDRDDIDSKIKRGIQMQQLGFSFQSIHQQVQIGDIPFEEEIRRVTEQVKAGIIPYGMNTQLDPLMALFSGMAVQQGNGQPEKTEALLEQIRQLNERVEKKITPGGRILEAKRR